MTSEPLIHTRQLTKRYGKTLALDNFDLDLAPGQIVGLLGENGCGKTTLLKTLAGMDQDFTGTAQIAGHDIGPETKALVSFLPDTSFLADSAKVTECIHYFDDFFADFDADKARDTIAFFGLDASSRLNEMSKGMREKVQVALTMARRARVFLLDEPISGVDPAARQVILDGVLRNLEPESLLMISTHLIHDLEPVLDSVVMMRHGKLLQQGYVDDLRAEHSKSIDQIFQEMYR
ncbi:ABC transporter ATP-binding protein [Gulosibacter bifidus]|uniref:ABC transporter ATP-binding protein n=1 Tax=Gulosibacter bifidus TaxID=272239 RepID=A0ABW5RJB7_9MICO|nr:ABC transporter ATP-binding protein [Gulosibacter bifidus]